MQIRKANLLDTERLIKMRWDFTIEDHPKKSKQMYTRTKRNAADFLRRQSRGIVGTFGS